MKTEEIPCHWIFLADDEWGNDTMLAAALEYFAAHPEAEFVEVHEHAGWWLAYHRTGVVIGTANDRAMFPPALREILERARHRVYAGETRRLSAKAA